MLSKEQKAFIKEKRLLGWGYKSIASCLQVERDNVRNYCKTAGLIGRTPRDYTPKPPPRHTCKQCGSPLTQPELAGRKKMFCCEACRRTWWKEHPEAKKQNTSEKYLITCPVCGRLFSIYGRPRQRYCSRSCATKGRYIEHITHTR